MKRTHSSSAKDDNHDQNDHTHHGEEEPQVIHGEPIASEIGDKETHEEHIVLKLEGVEDGVEQVLRSNRFILRKLTALPQRGGNKMLSMAYQTPTTPTTPTTQP
jgi:hypothetical protein